MRRGSAASVFATGCCALVDGKSGASKLNADHRRALAEVVEAGPVPAVDGVVRWRRKDLARWLLERSPSRSETTVGRELKALGFAKISARPRHYAQNELAVEAFKAKKLPRRTGEDPGEAPERRRDRAVVMKPASARRISSHADGPDVARARGRPATSAPNGPISSVRSVPRRGKAPGWSCPGATPTPWRRTSSRSVPPSIPAPMRC